MKNKVIKIDNLLIEKTLKLTAPKSVFDTLGLSGSAIDNTLTFLDDERFFEDVLRNSHISGVITTELFAKRLLSSRNEVIVIVSDNPRYDFFTLQNAVADLRLRYELKESIIDDTAIIHPTAYISPNNVIIGKNVVIEPNVTILSNVEIGEGTIIRSGTVIGSEGFEFKKTTKGILSVKHDGKVIVGSNVSIGANCAIAKGFFYRDTIIKDETKIDNLVFIAHGCEIGKRCFIVASAMLAGNITMGEDVWVGPNSTISSRLKIGNNAYITLGSVVTKDINDDEKVTGNFAVPHRQFLSILKNNISTSQKT